VLAPDLLLDARRTFADASDDVGVEGFPSREVIGHGLHIGHHIRGMPLDSLLAMW
jgi:hypothetical protein